MVILRHSSLWADIMWQCTMIPVSIKLKKFLLEAQCRSSRWSLPSWLHSGCGCNLLLGPRLFLYGWRQVQLWLQLATLSNVTAQFGAPSGSAGLPCLGPPPQLHPFCLHPGCTGRSRGSSICSVCGSFSHPQGSLEPETPLLIMVTVALSHWRRAQRTCSWSMMILNCILH